MSLSSVLYSKHTLSTAVYSLLIPLLMKLPDTQLTPPSASSPSLRCTPSRSTKTATTTAVTSPDQHPTSIPATTTAPSDLPEQPCQHEGPIASLRGADVCTQLPSSQTYLAYLWSKVHFLGTITLQCVLAIQLCYVYNGIMYNYIRNYIIIPYQFHQFYLCMYNNMYKELLYYSLPVPAVSKLMLLYGIIPAGHGADHYCKQCTFETSTRTGLIHNTATNYLKILIFYFMIFFNTTIYCSITLLHLPFFFIP